MHTKPVARPLVTWALILLGAAEIPWVIYLAFTQTVVVQVFHLRLATLGLGGLSATLCAGAAWTVARRGSWAAALCVAAATTLAFLATVGKLTPSLRTSGLLGSGGAPLLVVLPGVAAAVYAGWVLLARHTPSPAGMPEPAPRGLRMAAGVLALTAVVVAARMVLHVMQWDSEAMATHTRGVIVILDTLEALGLLGAGLASRAGRVRGTLVLATMAGILLVCDAYGNVVMAASGQAFNAALFYLVVGELPSIAACALAVRSAQRHLSSDPLVPATD